MSKKTKRIDGKRSHSVDPTVFPGVLETPIVLTSTLDVLEFLQKMNSELQMPELNPDADSEMEESALALPGKDPDHMGPPSPLTLDTGSGCTSGSLLLLMAKSNTQIKSEAGLSLQPEDDKKIEVPLVCPLVSPEIEGSEASDESEDMEDVMEDMDAPEPEPEGQVDSPQMDEGEPALAPTEDHYLRQNSSIMVNVDDLSPGTIVATYTHSNGNLYQGVLLHINRERGIPCGISFPKNYCSSIPTSDFNEDEEISSIHRRETYFQGHPSEGPIKPVRRFNRATKTPARFKNGKIAMRFRNRPVLCTKCREYCEEKNGGPIVSGKGGKTESNNNNKKNVAGRKVKGSSKSVDEAELDSKESTKELEHQVQDEYVSIGSTGIIEPYWKRPLTTVKSNSEVKLEVATPTYLKSRNDDVLDKPRVPETRARNSCMNKSRNLKLCISKLSLKVQSGNEKVVPSEEIDKLQDNHAVPIRDVNQLVTLCQPAEFKAKDQSPTSECSSATEQEDGSGQEQEVDTRTKKRSSAVPLRFRDSPNLAAKVFSFKKRRDAEDGDDSCDVEVPSVFLSRLPGDLNNKLTVDVGDGNSCSSDFLNSMTASMSASNAATLNNDLVPEVVRAEPARTPTIKISFGSSGNGVVVQIPPKPKGEKAAKKEMKRAKKEAKKKLILGQNNGTDTTSPHGFSLLHPPHSPPRYSTHSPPTGNKADSPLPPVLIPHYQLEPTYYIANDDDDSVMNGGYPELVKAVESPQSTPPPKKRKKEKKKKKSRTRKASSSSRTDSLISSVGSDDLSPPVLFPKTEVVTAIPKLKIKLTSDNGVKTATDSPRQASPECTLMIS